MLVEIHMKGTTAVISALNKVLASELTAITQYVLDASIFERKGYCKLAGYQKQASMEEMKHLHALVDRILLLEGEPELAVAPKVKITDSPDEQLEHDLDLEVEAVKNYNLAIRAAVEHNDNGSRALLEDHLKSEESHVDWLEAQLHMINEIGIENYLSSQM
jgi:bacterioferritin